MSLGDIMSGIGQELFAEAAFVLAAAGFLTVLVTTLLRRNREAFERARFMPLREDPGAPRREEAATHE